MVSQSGRAKLRRRSIQSGRLLRQWRRRAKDEIEAYKWWLLAAGHGNDDAKDNVTIVEIR